MICMPYLKLTFVITSSYLTGSLPEIQRCVSLEYVPHGKQASRSVRASVNGLTCERSVLFMWWPPNVFSWLLTSSMKAKPHDSP